jgi:glutamate-1-semialdehyde 2,1-aminomutase
MTAGLATLKKIQAPRFFSDLENFGSRLLKGLEEIAQRRHVPVVTERVGAMFGFFFSERPVYNADLARQSNTDLFKQVFHKLLAHGIMGPPSPFEAWFYSACHDETCLNQTLNAWDEALQQIA